MSNLKKGLIFALVLLFLAGAVFDNKYGGFSTFQVVLFVISGVILLLAGIVYIFRKK